MAWDDEIRIAGSKVLPPEPRLMHAIGLNHRLETALADLVDNSIDAKATRVVIRFVRDAGRLLGLCVVDNGRGVRPSEIDNAMTLGGTKNYESHHLGHFGFGLKAASLGQAESLTFVSRAEGQAPVGRRWLSRNTNDSFECEVLTDASAADLFSRDWGMSLTTGSVVRWDHVRIFPRSNREATTDRYLEDTLVRVRHHLGLVFHRYLSDGRLALALDVYDAESNASSSAIPIEPLDPFGYLKSGAPRYPRDLRVDLGRHAISMTLHIWSPRSQLDGFRLGDNKPMESQGFYFYRNDRLLQSGGWNGVINADRALQLARVAVDIDDQVASQVSMNPEKTAVVLDRDIVNAIEGAPGDAKGFARYLEDAVATFKAAQKRTRARPKVVPPGRGFAPIVRRAIGEQFEFLPGEDPLDIRWADFSEEAFFSVDREQRTILLNKRYRWAVNGEKDSSLNDAPLLKAALYLILEDLFRGEFLGAKDRDNIQLWNSILTAAAQAECA